MRLLIMSYATVRALLVRSPTRYSLVRVDLTSTGFPDLRVLVSSLLPLLVRVSPCGRILIISHGDPLRLDFI